MIKTIEINEEQKFDVNSAAGWLFIYRSQFGHDILPDLLPMIEGIASAAINVVPQIDTKGKEVDVNTVLSHLDMADVSELIYSFAGLESVTIIDILWAMAKNADKSIETPETWINQFEVFPLDTIIPELFELIIKSSVSSKNAKSLQNLFKTAKKTTKKKSQ